MIIPTSKYWEPGEVATAANMQIFSDHYNYASNTPTCRLYSDTVTPATFGDGAYACLDSSMLELEDNDSMHNTVSAKWQLNFPTPGVYEISVRVVWVHFMSTLTNVISPVNCEFSTNIVLNNGGPANSGTMAANTIFEDYRTIQVGCAGADGNKFMSFGFTDYFRTSSGTDYLEFWFYQKTGATRTLQGGVGGTTLTAHLISTL